MSRLTRTLLSLLSLTLIAATVAVTEIGSRPANSPEAPVEGQSSVSPALRGESWRSFPLREQQPVSPVDPQPTTIEASLPASAAPVAQPLAARLPIVEYHYSTFYYDGVAMQTDWFLEQMQWLSDQGFNTLTIDELADYVEGTYQPPERSVALTFDVGISHFEDYSNVVIPALRRFGFHGIFFVQTQGVLDECDGTFTCWPSLREWYSEGLISIGSHTVYHRDFNTLSAAQIALELGGSKETIEQKLGVSVIGVCYPFDAPAPAAFPILESLGYRFAVGGYTRNERSAHFADAEPYNLPRYYPYSSEARYPVLTGSGGLTFAEMILGSIGPAR